MLNAQRQKKRIAIVSDAIYPYNKGGKEKRIFEIASRLTRKYDVHIYTMQWWNGDTIKKENGMTLHAISPLYPLYSGKRRSIREAVLFAFACLKLVNENFDILEADHMPHLVLFPIMLVTKLKRKKLFVTWNEVWGKEYWRKYLGKIGIVAYYIEMISVRTPDVIVAVSKHTKQNLIKKFHSKKRIFVISNGINSKDIQSIRPSKEISDVIFAGRLLEHKNVDILIEAIAILKKTHPKIRCFIIGQGPERKNLEKLANSLKLKNNISFFNFFPHHSDLYSLMKSSKVFVLPSSREGFGIVVIEANACGIPVLTVNSPDNAAKDLIQSGENGFVCNLDSQELSKFIRKIISEKIDNTYHEKSIKIAGNYDWESITKKVELIYGL